MKNKIIIYQNKSGAIEFKGDFKRETLWANLQQIADLFDTDKSGISRHINSIYKTGELPERSTVAKIATVQKEGNRYVKREIEYYNLDVILSVGYRVNSKDATKFRQWATNTLRQHILNGYTINKKQLVKNTNAFFQAVEGLKKLLGSAEQVKAIDALALVKMFALTWLSLDAYDKASLPKSGATKKQVRITAEHILKAVEKLKEELVAKNEASDLFAAESMQGNVAGIIGNIFQSFGGSELYPTLEEKAAHLLYFIVKNHPFIDGNKRSGAFAFIWFLRKAKLLDISKLTPEALTALTLLVAESNPKDKERLIGLILMILKK